MLGVSGAAHFEDLGTTCAPTIGSVLPGSRVGAMAWVNPIAHTSSLHALLGFNANGSCVVNGSWVRDPGGIL